MKSEEEDPIIDTEDSEIEDGEKELSEEEKERQRNLRAKLASMKWGGDSDSESDEGEGDEDTDITETEGEEEAKNENDDENVAPDSKPESNGAVTNGGSKTEEPVPSKAVDNTVQHEEKEQEKEQQHPASAPSTPPTTTTPATPTLTTTPTSPRDSTDKIPVQPRPLTESAPAKSHLHPNPSKKWKKKQMKKLKRVSAELPPTTTSDNNGGTTSHTNPLITKQGLKVKGGSLRGSKPKRKETKTLNPLTAVPKLRIDSSDELVVPSSPKSFRSPRYTPAIELFATGPKKVR